MPGFVPGIRVFRWILGDPTRMDSRETAAKPHSVLAAGRPSG